MDDPATIFLVLSIGIALALFLVGRRQFEDSKWRELAQRIGFSFEEKRGLIEGRCIYGDHRDRAISLYKIEIGGDQESPPVFFTEMVASVALPKDIGMHIKPKGVLQKIREVLIHSNDQPGFDYFYSQFSFESIPDQFVHFVLEPRGLQRRFTQIPLVILKISDGRLVFRTRGFDVKGSRESYIFLIDTLCDIADRAESFRI